MIEEKTEYLFYIQREKKEMISQGILFARMMISSRQGERENQADKKLKGEIYAQLTSSY